MKKAILALAVLAVTSSAMALDTRPPKGRCPPADSEFVCPPEDEGMNAMADWLLWFETDPVDPAPTQPAPAQPAR